MYEMKFNREKPCAFVIPFWSDGHPKRLRHLASALETVRDQTDDNCIAIVVDDASPAARDRDTLREWADRDDRLIVLSADENRGPGRCRNLGIREAARIGCSFICFLDADDCSHPSRALGARDIFDADPTTQIVYSGLSIIDEAGAPVDRRRLLPGIRTILEDLELRPLEGDDIWVALATERDTLTVPSALSVRTTVALEIPFPEDVRFHEDTHTWLRYSASGARIKFNPHTPSLYRIPQESVGSESRSRAGGLDAFNRLRAQVIMRGLLEATEMGLRRRVIDSSGAEEIQTRYLMNVAAMLQAESSMVVASELVAQARALSPQCFARFMTRYGLDVAQ